MTFTTHAVIGAAAAQFFPNSLLAAFIVGFISHFAADAIPHWDYHLKSYRRDKRNPLRNNIVLNRQFIGDIIKIGCDFWLGIILAWIAFAADNPALCLTTIVGAVGGILPDALQFVYFKVRQEPFTSLQRMHIHIHAKTRIGQEYYIMGIFIQIMLMVTVVFLTQSLTSP